MTELRIRPYRDADAEAVADLMNAIDTACGAEAVFTAGEMRGFVKGWVRDPVTDSRMVVTEDGVLAAAGFVAAPPEGGPRADLFGGVDPNFRAQGIGRELLAWQCDRTSELHAALAPETPWHVDAGASVDDSDAVRLFQRLGFEPVRYFFDMVAPFNGEMRVLELPDGITAAAFTHDLSRALYEAHMEAFSDHWGFQRRPYEKWIHATIGSEEFRPDLSRVAFDGADIAAYVLAYDNIKDRMYIGQVGTRRPWRGRGLASALISTSLAAGAAAGKSDASLGVDADNPTGAVGVYERLGFAVRHKYVTYRRGVE